MLVMDISFYQDFFVQHFLTGPIISIWPIIRTDKRALVNTQTDFYGSEGVDMLVVGGAK
jgi:hypothetical protein